MARFKKISTSVSIAATVLVEACSSSDPGPTPVPNTTAPELVGEWRSACVNISSPRPSTETITYARASGGSGSSGGGGDSYRDSIVFSQNGQAQFLSEYFATANCNANTLAGVERLNYVYVVGDAATANDSSSTTELNYSASGTTVYSMFQVVNSGVELHIGDNNQSSPGHDGSSSATRLDGLGGALTKQ